jgi:hypothetical protein
MATKIVTLRPVQDISPLWTPTPNDGTPHYTKVDEGVANADGDTTKLEASNPGLLTVFRLDALPPSLKQTISARFKAVAKSTVGTNLGFGFIFNGVLLDPPPEIGYDFTLLPLNLWIPIDQPILGFPILTDRETTIDIVLISAVTGGETVSLTAFELELTYATSPSDFDEVGTPTTSFTPVTTPTTNFSPVAGGSTIFNPVPNPATTFDE